MTSHSSRPEHRRRIHGLWFPSDDNHFEPFLSRGPYQQDQRATALRHCHQFRTAIDIGAHVGTWSVDLERVFTTVHAFEPVPANVECLMLNTDPERTRVYPVALGDGSRSTTVLGQVREGNSGTWAEFVDSDPTKGVVADSRTLDSYLFTDVDFIKLDAECAELAILHGARETIRRNQPVICVELRQREILERHGFPARYDIDELVDFLRTLNMHEVGCTFVDHVFAHRSILDA